MPTKTKPTVAIPQSPQERLDLANQLFRDFYTRCFWYCPPNLIITEELVPFVVKGLRLHGGHRGFLLAGKLLHKTPPSMREKRWNATNSQGSIRGAWPTIS